MPDTNDLDNSPIFDERPWGNFTVLEDSSKFKVKRIEVFSGKRLSYQRHSRRSEHWFIIQGTAKVTLNGKNFIIESGGSIDIPVETLHRVENPVADELLVFIEIQTGDYFGEDDIVRIEDDFGRN